MVFRLPRCWPAAALVLAAACSDRPKAPPLTTEAAFQDDRIGLRFLVPAGWTIQSRTAVPDGPPTRTIVVASYRRTAGAKPATFEILAMSLPPDADPERYLAEHGPGSEKWVRGSPAAGSVGGAGPIRFVQVREPGKGDTRRDVVAYRRGERTYYFVLTAPASDAEARAAIRTTIDSITWAR